MKITVEWLKEFVETGAGAQEIGDELTMLGLELEAEEESALGPVLDFKVTPNRGDCLSVFGLARELAAKDPEKYRPTDLFKRAAEGFSSVDLPHSDGLVSIEAPEVCGRYVGAVVQGVRVGKSLEKIAERLTACGMRPIDSIVDTTNYVMLELGQPLHAFDLRQLKAGRIVVRTAKQGETMKTLDGQERKLTPDMLMICDAERPVAIAGVMGGENSEVALDTTEILLESAHFDPLSVRRTRKALGMSTEASYRFERSVDPGLCAAAVNRVCELLGVSASQVQDAYPGRAERSAVRIRRNAYYRMFGSVLAFDSAPSILTRLGCNVTQDGDDLMAAPPSWRADLAIEEDFLEEIGRLWGYEKIEEDLPRGSTTGGGYGPEADFRRRLRQALLRLGFAEMLTHSLAQESSLGSGSVAVRNAASPELALLRGSLLPGLATAAGKNRGRSLALFEQGRVFEDRKERRSLGLLVSGDVAPAHWAGTKPSRQDFYSLKGIVETIGTLIGRRIDFAPSNDARFHPGRRAALEIEGETLGAMGEIAPALCDELDLPQDTLAAEVDVDRLMAAASKQTHYRKLSPYPPVRRDFAVVIEKSVPYAKLEAALRAAAGGLAERVWLFDAYEGKGIDAGSHSLGIGVVLRHADRTLTDEEANAFSERAFAALESLGARKRT
jgi:phenylalanyl-tRNA synthetase beta chain